jgi:hypothetical protein
VKHPQTLQNYPSPLNPPAFSTARSGVTVVQSQAEIYNASLTRLFFEWLVLHSEPEGRFRHAVLPDLFGPPAERLVQRAAPHLEGIPGFALLVQEATDHV